MKLLIFLCVLVVGALAQPVKDEHHCLYDSAGICYEECPEGTHSYTTGCGKKTPEETCAEPHPVEEEDIICDYSACYCDPPTVRDTSSNKCVKLEDCPKSGEGEKTPKQGVL